MTPSYLRPGSVNLHYWQPTMAAGSWVPAGRWLGAITEQVSRYTHELRAHGGYWQATISFGARIDVAEEWLDTGLARHVETYDEAAAMCFEGFVDMVQMDVGGYSITRGPLTELANRAALVFSALDTSVTPPRAGPRARTGVNNNSASQERYGIHYKVLTASSILAADSLQLRDAYLADASYVATDRRLTIGGTTTPSVTLTIKGYVHMLDYPYNNALTGNTTIAAKVPLVLAGEPNGLFTGTPQSVAANATAVEAAESEDNGGWSVLTTLCGYGDSAYNRYVCTVGAGRAFAYAALPTTTAYQLVLRDPRQPITTVGGAEVRPWNVQAGQWLFLPDMLIGRVPASTPLREDPRALYIESLTYDAPVGLTITGGRADTITQRLARLGLAGIGGA